MSFIFNITLIYLLRATSPCSRVQNYTSIKFLLICNFNLMGRYQMTLYIKWCYVFKQVPPPTHLIIMAHDKIKVIHEKFYMDFGEQANISPLELNSI